LKTFFRFLVVRELHLVGQVHHFGQEFQVGSANPFGKLHAPVEVDGQTRFFEPVDTPPAPSV